ncbi:DUF885 domain-containing protein [Undibacterium luofuense]|uniref:DUF885 domain-containing protein n=1 Tax=Undibacterium luofuense TaxID=2828733 RepID=A0A941DL87_9BURK|nr:DUF885 domain-containing protein [Undibacterium luofuense]MBR7782893.1 DUF885 domain-containing protein [Undibacterium luofuense]
MQSYKAILSALALSVAGSVLVVPEAEAVNRPAKAAAKNTKKAAPAAKGKSAKAAPKKGGKASAKAGKAGKGGKAAKLAPKRGGHEDIRLIKSAEFANTRAYFLKDFWQQDPETAMSAGRYDAGNRLSVQDEPTREQYLQFCERWLKTLGNINETYLPAADKTDLAMMRQYLESSRWYINTFKEFAWNPSVHNVAGGFDSLINTPFAPLEKRLRLISERLIKVPAYYAAAQQGLQQPTREHTQLAVAQVAGTLAVFDLIADQAKTSTLSSTEKADLKSRLQDARIAVTGYRDHLQKLLNTTPDNGWRSFRIGKELYEAKFKADIQSDLSAEQMYQKALAAKEDALTRMAALADQLWPKVMGDTAKPEKVNQRIKMVIDKLSEKHVSADQLYPEIRRQLPVLEAWIRQKDLLNLDASKPLVVRETPEYQRGVTVASIEAPGIFRPRDNTYYNVTPLTGQPPEQIESTLREYNHWVLQILNIHEAIPGHYTQLQHANQSMSVIKALYGNGAMIEGWAVYSERMMLESGYGGDTPEMWLMYYKWNLRTICNTILDYSVHVLGMTQEEALRFLMEDAFQTQAEARGKWSRVQYSSVQLTSYFSGYADIMAFRDQQKQKLGKDFRLKTFHEQFLSYGSAPVAMIRKMMEEAQNKPEAAAE